MDVERVNLQPCFVLHQRAYRNSSVILEVFSQDFGRVALLAKGVKQQKSRLKSVLQTFQPLQLSWVRRSELGTLTTAEFAGQPIQLSHEKLYAALYVNELCLRLLVHNDSASEIYHAYFQSIQQLSQLERPEKVLRLFEKVLLQSLGYEIQLCFEADTHEPIFENCVYQYVPEHGFIKIEEDNETQKFLFKGEHLLAFEHNELENEEVLKVAHRLTHISLRKLLGDKPLKSRELYIAYRSMQNA